MVKFDKISLEVIERMNKKRRGSRKVQPLVQLRRCIAKKLLKHELQAVRDLAPKLGCKTKESAVLDALALLFESN